MKDTKVTYPRGLRNLQEVEGELCSLGELNAHLRLRRPTLDPLS